MKTFTISILLFLLSTSTHAQEQSAPAIDIGSPAPVLKAAEWIKGSPVMKFERGHIYVIEFWATWCVPCIEQMPHLSLLADKYKGKVTIIGMDIKEKRSVTKEWVQKFVDSMDYKMQYTVAIDDNDFMATNWYEASGERGIPKSIVINEDGIIAWIGHPVQLGETLEKMVKNEWDIKEALTQRNFYRKLERLDKEAADRLKDYCGKGLDTFGDPDSALIVVDELVSKEPQLKYAPLVAFYTFSSLLKVKMDKAAEYARVLIKTSTYTNPYYNAVIKTINDWSLTLSIRPEIYKIGAEAYQAMIDRYPHSATPGNYSKMAEWYWRASDKEMALQCQYKVIELMQQAKDNGRGYSW